HSIIAVINVHHQEMAMMRQVLAATIALSLTGASVALAQQGAPQQGAPQQGAPQQGAPQQGAPQQGTGQQGAGQQGAGQQEPGRDRMGWRPSAEDVAAFTDARIAGLKAGLKLTPEQEKNWPAVEAA